jgi:hypothetical protein
MDLLGGNPSLSLGDLHYAEQVSIGVLQDNKVIVWFVSPRIAGRPNHDQPFYFALSVGCIEVEM